VLTGLVVLLSGISPPPPKFWAPSMSLGGVSLAEVESDVMRTFMCLLSSGGRFSLQSVWRTGMPAMRLHNYQFDRLVGEGGVLQGVLGVGTLYMIL